MNGFKVLKSSLLTTIQDCGRFGFANIGVSTSGALDEYSYHWANKLLGNKYNTNALEIVFSGLELESTIDTQIALTGADFLFSINDIVSKLWQVHNIKKGDILKFGKINKGQRAYFSVKDGFDIKEEFNSCSTSLKTGIGGLNSGLAIKTDDFLPCSSSNIKVINRVQKQYIPKYENEVVLRVIESYQNDMFSQKYKDIFYSNEYLVTNDFNAMACKLKGQSIIANTSGIISEGISYGSIQIPNDGQPIILLKERQTIGGYPKFGCVISIDCFKLAQLKAKDKIIFEKIEPKEAQEKLIKFYKFFKN